MTNRELLQEKWLWNREVRSIVLFYIFFSGIMLSIILYPSTGPLAVAEGFLPFLFFGSVIGIVYGYVGRRVIKLKQTIDPTEGEMAEGLLQIGHIQGPGFIIRKENELVLVPLVGERLIIPFRDISTVRESRSLYGKGFFRKRAFLIEAPRNSRIGFALVPSVAQRWRIYLLAKGEAR